MSRKLMWSCYWNDIFIENALLNGLIVLVWSPVVLCAEELAFQRSVDDMRNQWLLMAFQNVLIFVSMSIQCCIGLGIYMTVSLFSRII